LFGDNSCSFNFIGVEVFAAVFAGGGSNIVQPDGAAVGRNILYAVRLDKRIFFGKDAVFCGIVGGIVRIIDSASDELWRGDEAGGILSS